jgi:hypothetical protein
MTDLRLDNLILQKISLSCLNKQFFEVRDFFAKKSKRIARAFIL